MRRWPWSPRRSTTSAPVASSASTPSRASTPAGYCVWLSKANHTYRLALRAQYLAIHFLGAQDHDLAELFGTLSGDDVDKFERASTTMASQASRSWTGAANWLVVERVALLDEGGDHVCIVTESLVASFGGSFTPLRLSDVDDLDPGTRRRRGPEILPPPARFLRPRRSRSAHRPPGHGRRGSRRRIEPSSESR